MTPAEVILKSIDILRVKEAPLEIIKEFLTFLPIGGFEVEGAIMPLKLTIKEKECVKEWLGLFPEIQRTKCPFFKIKGNSWRDDFSRYCKICRSWFPKLKPIIHHPGHPCGIYRLSTVIRRAKEMVK